MTQLEIKREAVRKPFNRRRKACPFSGPMRQRSIIKIQSFLPATHLSAEKSSRHASLLFLQKKQRELATAIKRSRFLALMPYVTA